jgi:hypothetical protein
MPTLPATNTSVEPVADWFHARRGIFRMVLLCLTIVLLVLAGYCGYQGFRLSPVTESETTAIVAPGETTQLERTPYRIVAILGFLGAIVVGAVAGYLFGVLPNPADDKRRFQDRLAILIGGGLFGLLCIVCGGLLFAVWFNKLGDWLNGIAGAQKSAWMPIVAILVTLLGAGITFASVIPARGEERNNTLIRRLVYGSNLALSVLLSIIGLIVLNLIISMKLPAKLDTTESQFYSISDQTRDYIAGLKQDVKLYALTAETAGRAERVQADALRLLDACAEVNPKRFQVKILSPVLDRNEIDALSARYPEARLSNFGVLITTGDNFERRGFVEFQKMIAVDQQVGRMTFKGEAELIRELMFRTEKESVIYFTQSSGEPQVERTGDALPGGRPAFRLKDDLARSQCIVKPLVLGAPGVEPKVPDDADLVVVLDPQSSLPEPTIIAIQKFLSGANPKKKKGRLLVFSGARPTANGKEIVATGLEPLLESQGIILLKTAIYSEPDGKLASNKLLGFPDELAKKERNPVAVLNSRGLPIADVRPVAPKPGEGGQPTSRGLMRTQNGRYSWLENKIYNPAGSAWQEILAADKRGDVAYQKERNLTQQPIWVAAYSTNTESSPVVAAFGFSDGFEDDAPVGDDGRSVMSKLMSTTVDWLRERPPAPDIAPKSYGEYIPAKGISTTNLIHVPVFSILIGIVLLGLGVWVYRRK